MSMMPIWKSGAVAAVALLATLAGPATAAEPPPAPQHHEHAHHTAHGHGLVDAPIPLKVRTGPGTGYRIVRAITTGTSLTIACKTVGANVLGNALWYRLPHHGGYVSARYVRNTTVIPWC